MEYDDLVKKMEKQGIVFIEGLRSQEVNRIEKQFGINFPLQMKCFYRTALPVSKGFYNWRDNSDKNVMSISKAIERPALEIIEGVGEVEWNPKWGKEPSESEERARIIVNMILEAPKLIPVYSHRYMASIACEESPVFSIQGADVIYYAKNLSDYFMIEFGLKEYEVFKDDKVSHIPFWSDIL